MAATPRMCGDCAILGVDEIIVCDLMLCQVLQGLGSEQAARDVEALLRRFEIVSMPGDAIAVAGARNFRFLRRAGSQFARQSTF